MALSAVLTRAGHPPASIETTATAHLRTSGSSADVSQIELVTGAVVPGISEAQFVAFAAEAKTSCPLSKALAAVPIY